VAYFKVLSRNFLVDVLWVSISAGDHIQKLRTVSFFGNSDTFWDCVIIFGPKVEELLGG